MRRILFILILLVSSVSFFAQSETHSTLNISPEDREFFDSFFLDISMPSLPRLPEFNPNRMLGPDVTKDYSILFQPDTKWTFGKAYVLSPMTISSGFYSSTQPLQKATIQLNDKMRLSLYGQYNSDGKRIPNTNGLPWDRDSFVGGMELKFNKNFGVRVEVRQGGRNPMNPYP